MPAYELCRALHHLYADRDRAAAARAGDFASLDALPLTSRERAAIAAVDLVELYRLGAHPVTLFHFATVFKPRQGYVRDIVPRLRGIPNPFGPDRP